MEKDSNHSFIDERIGAIYEVKTPCSTIGNDLNGLLEIALQLSGLPLASISFFTDEGLIHQSKIGFDVTHTSGEMSFLLKHLTADGCATFNNILNDEQWQNVQLTDDAHAISFFTCAAIQNMDGAVIGFMSLMDTAPGSGGNFNYLKKLACQASALVSLSYSQLAKSDAQTNGIFQASGDMKAFYENILNKLPTDIAVFDPNHKYLFVNPGAISDEDLRKFIIGKDDFEYAAYRNRSVDVAQRRRERFLLAANSNVEIKWEDTLNDPDGVPITHLRRLFPVRNENGELLMVIGYGIDITERKIMENKQAVLVKQLSVQNTQLTDFCNIVSHNLRAPLVNMSMLVQYIEESEDDTDRMELIKMLKPVVENLHGTFGELVESIQIKQDHEVQSEKIKLTDYVERTLKELKFEANKSQAEFEIDFNEAPVILFPSKYIFSIIHNLLSNALKYRAPERKPLIRIATKKENDSVILSVSDNGLGIDLEKHGKSFFKIGKVFHKNPNAKGFGLFMTKTQVEAMGGTIWVESKPNEGSTFFIEFKNQKLQSL